jgi:hypothetical protein
MQATPLLRKEFGVISEERPRAVATEVGGWVPLSAPPC